MTINTELDKVISRVRKILALANNNPNEAERDVALRHASNLLAKYNLDMSTIENASGIDDVGEVRPALCTEKWAIYVVQAVCELYYCRCFITHLPPKKQLVIVGTQANTAIASEIAFWVIESVRKESNRQFSTPIERRSFRLGAAIRLQKRALEIIDEESRRNEHVQHAKANGNRNRNSLVIVRNRLSVMNNDYVSEKYPKLQQSRSRASSVSLGAFHAGESYGNDVGLTRQIDR